MKHCKSKKLLFPAFYYLTKLLFTVLPKESNVEYAANMCNGIPSTYLSMLFSNDTLRSFFLTLGGPSAERRQAEKENPENIVKELSLQIVFS